MVGQWILSVCLWRRSEGNCKSGIKHLLGSNESLHVVMVDGSKDSWPTSIVVPKLSKDLDLRHVLLALKSDGQSSLLYVD